MSEAIDRYVKENEARFLEELKDLLRIPSISTLPENNEATHRAADFVVDHLMAAGMELQNAVAADKARTARYQNRAHRRPPGARSRIDRNAR